MKTRAKARNKSLNEYRAKRNFRSTPEPSGKPAKPSRTATRQKAKRYCIQKHQATRLHYDLRLEHNGVLLSWAVPKGPSLDPREKRLAMRVEDHPIEYVTFEGVIPDGYGAGVVLLWDRGKWMPEEGGEADIDAALARGELKFRLAGKKLNGEWILVRTGGRAGKGESSRAWLLIKRRDEYARASRAAVEDLDPHSVKSGGNFGDIIMKNKRTISRALKGPDARKLRTRLANAVHDAAENHPK